MKRINCFNKRILAAITDVSVDFKLLPDMSGLNDGQKEYLRQHLGFDQVVNIRQVHGNKVVYADSIEQSIEEADALITDKPAVPIAIRTADCVPVFLHDPMHEAIAVVHAGWQSTNKKIVQATLDAMAKQFGTVAADVHVYIGPCIRKSSFEVGPEFKDYFPEEYEEINGKGHVDVAQANINQLIARGVRADNIDDCEEDTFSSGEWFSFRRDADNSGRMLHVMMIK